MDRFPGFPGEVIGIMAIISFFAFAAIFFIGLFYILFRVSKNRHEERIEMIKSGREIPINMAKYSGNRTLYWGYLFSAFGSGVFILGIIDMI